MLLVVVLFRMTCLIASYLFATARSQNPAPEAKEKFQEISEAYQCCTDPNYKEELSEDEYDEYEEYDDDDDYDYHHHHHHHHSHHRYR
jgi:DnaJ-class molecular chaperone